MMIFWKFRGAKIVNAVHHQGQSGQRSRGSTGGVSWYDVKEAWWMANTKKALVKMNRLW
jgi:hypothetical protein